MDNGVWDDVLYPDLHPLKIFDAARRQDRFLYVSAPMVRYSKLAFRRTVYEYGTDICFTPMILSKEFNRSHFARDSDLTLSTQGPQPPTIVQFGANSPTELTRSSSLVAPYVNGVDLNCGCPQSWACAETMGAALMGRRELVRDMVVETRERLARDGWAVDKEKDMENPKGRSISVKIRVHTDLRRTMDFIDTVIGHPQDRHIDFLTIHPRTRTTPSSAPIFGESLAILVEKYGDTLPILLSGDVFSLASLPLSPLLSRNAASPTITTSADPSRDLNPASQENGSALYQSPQTTSPSIHFKPSTTKLAGLMSARGILANPALYAGHESCPWSAVESFLRHAARAPLHLKLIVHHLNDMCGPGMGPDKHSLLSKAERIQLNSLTNMVDVIDFMDDMIERKTGRVGGVARAEGEGVERLVSRTPVDEEASR
ncbi:FMN-linked oxidoreductase [Sodiomyces alkalinus F11]|uniref:FMN-linked oxidoreductase n=1 Tax=Sodiomyces alkalinus (strain CBS 110278 / VKM F-3762 / F11) TaxID=1314773 RepID=A0A3N2PSE5_SODAK|nr:FMN-linked oxidoreductase [Sodiomyces alkalinus F11]ROT37427.1 FMN-linked oxidoreductase [Sodiomyces alkalinus F11]